MTGATSEIDPGRPTSEKRQEVSDSFDCQPVPNHSKFGKSMKKCFKFNVSGHTKSRCSFVNGGGKKDGFEQHIARIEKFAAKTPRKCLKYYFQQWRGVKGWTSRGSRG
jgi:hypothetical protein